MYVGSKLPVMRITGGRRETPPPMPSAFIREYVGARTKVSTPTPQVAPQVLVTRPWNRPGNQWKPGTVTYFLIPAASAPSHCRDGCCHLRLLRRRNQAEGSGVSGARSRNLTPSTGVQRGQRPLFGFRPERAFRSPPTALIPGPAPRQLPSASDKTASQCRSGGSIRVRSHDVLAVGEGEESRGEGPSPLEAHSLYRNADLCPPVRLPTGRHLPVATPRPQPQPRHAAPAVAVPGGSKGGR